MSDTSLMTGLDAISATLGAATPIATIPRPTQDPSKELAKVDEAPEIEDDYQEARSNLKELISQAMEQVPELIELTKQAQSDKMYQAAASFIKAAADLNISLSKLSKDIRTPKQQKGQPAPSAQEPTQQNIQNNVYIGSTEDFLEMMDQRQKAREEAAALEAEYVEVKET